MVTPRHSPTLGAIAATLRVSVATVSNALSGKGRVSPELVDRIRAKAEELGYVPSMTARALRTGRSGVLGLVLPNIGNPLFPQIAQAIENAASDAGYGVLIADSRSDNNMQTLAIQRLLERQVDGIVIVPRFGTRIADLGCPVAVIDSPSTPGNTVSADHWQGGQLLVDHLVSLGHRNFVLVGANQRSNVQNDRIGGMKSRLPKGGRAEIVWIEKIEAEAGAGCLLGLADLVQRGFTAFAATSDLHALRLLTELQRSGISVPDEASVVGFDDLVWSSAISPSITTVRQDMATIAEIAIAALIGVIDRHGGDVPDEGGMATAHRDRVPMTIVARQSSGVPAGSPAHEFSSKGEDKP